MQKYIDIILKSYHGYWNYLKYELIDINHWDNYFYGLIVISLLVWTLEALFPWRKDQSLFREGFWLDIFYMFFNFFLLNLVALIALSNTFEALFIDILEYCGIHIDSFQILNVNVLPPWLGLLIFFLVTDFVQWNTHRLLHRVPWLWNFHKVHHSIKQMGFAGHLRYHWMEPVIYNSLLYIPLAMIGGFEAQEVAIVFFFAIAIGHLNHANLGWSYGPLKYILNNPKMHIWHHAKEMPAHRKNGINYGISLSLWDYIFGTHHLPHDGRDVELGFADDEKFPTSFVGQSIYPLGSKNAKD